MENDFPPTSFHQICFTVPRELRPLLDECRFLLNCLFKASAQTVLSWSKQRHLLPAIVSSCHTFERDLKFHPHIHMLMSSGGIDLKSKRINRWKSYPFIPYKMLHQRYRSLLLKSLKQAIRKYLKENPDPRKLSVFSHPGVLIPSSVFCLRLTGTCMILLNYPTKILLSPTLFVMLKDRL